MPATSAKKQETDNGYIFTRAKLLRARRAVRTRNGEVEGFSRQLATLPGALKHNWQAVGDNVDKAADEKSEKRNEAEKKSRVAD